MLLSASGRASSHFLRVPLTFPRTSSMIRYVYVCSLTTNSLEYVEQPLTQRKTRHETRLRYCARSIIHHKRDPSTSVCLGSAHTQSNACHCPSPSRFFLTTLLLASRCVRCQTVGPYVPSILRRPIFSVSLSCGNNRAYRPYKSEIRATSGSTPHQSQAHSSSSGFSSTGLSRRL